MYGARLLVHLGLPEVQRGLVFVFASSEVTLSEDLMLRVYWIHILW